MVQAELAVEDTGFPNELSPLLMGPHNKSWHEQYEASDSELDPGSVVDWDAVEEEVKTLYPSALTILWGIVRDNRNFIFCAQRCCTFIEYANFGMQIGDNLLS